MLTLKSKIKRYILDYSPGEQWLYDHCDKDKKKIINHATFEDMVLSLINGEDVYQWIPDDSIDREYAFNGLCEVFNTDDYDLFYLSWLGHKDIIAKLKEAYNELL